MQRHHVLAGARPEYPGVTRNREWGVNVYTCPPDRYPERLEAYRPPAHSWERMVERFLNGDPAPGAVPVITPEYRPWQPKQIAAIEAADRGYTLAFPTGSGKTFMSILGAQRRRPARVLVISPVSHVSTWRADITKFGTGGAEWVVINPQRLGWLLKAPDPTVLLQSLGREARDEQAANTGIPIVPFDIVIADEAHFLTNPESLRSRLWRRLVQWGDDGPQVFTLSLSATPWTNPMEMWSAAHLIALATETDCPGDERVGYEWGDHLYELGLRVKQVRKRWHWTDNPEDAARLTGWVYKGGRGATATASEIGLPSQERVLRAIPLTASERILYEKPWAPFRADFGLPEQAWAQTDPVMARRLREVQKASLVKAKHVATVVAEYVTDGYSVVVPTWYDETVTEVSVQIVRSLKAHGVKPRLVTINGETDVATRERRRRLFQSGDADVLVTSITDSISLHAGEKGGGVDKQDASDRPRVTVFLDVLTGGKRALQAEGRAQRDGQKALAVYTYADNTTEQDWLRNVLLAMADTRAMTLDHSDITVPEEHDIAALTEMAARLERP